MSSDSPVSSSAAPTLESGSKGPVEEREPNDDILHANDIVFGKTVRAQIRPVLDKDFFRVRIPAGGSGDVRVVLSNRSKLMPEVEVWDRHFNSVTSKYSVYGDLYHGFEAEPDSDYFVECRFIVVNRNFADPGDSGSYELTVLSASK